MTKRTKPEILAKQTVAQSKLFSIESLDLKFSNGELRTYERMKPSGRNAVMMVPITEQGDILLVREYAAGTERYELGFPKGKVDLGETWAQAAVRESQEEIGLLPNDVTLLDSVSLAAGYMTHYTHIVLATGLIPQSAEGDEPEPLEIVPWHLDDWQALLKDPHFSEGRAYAALMLVLKDTGRI